MADRNDPHTDLHDLAAGDGAQHDPVTGPSGESLEEKVDRINKELTKRINDLRTDNDKFKKATSNSVKTVQDGLDTANTSIQNNKDSIAAQDALIGEAKTAAAEAKTEAKGAAAKADKVAADLGGLTTEVRGFEQRYAAHTHDVQITMHGETTGPKAGN